MTAAYGIYLDSLRSDVVIDWGDGRREKVTPENRGMILFDGNKDEYYTVKIYGAVDAIPHFYSSSFTYMEFVVEEGCQIESITLYPGNSNTIEHMDLSNAHSLKYIELMIYFHLFKDDLAFRNMIDSLSLRSAESPGVLAIRGIVFSWHIHLCAEKNWSVTKI